VLTYASETRAENNLYPATSLRTAEMKIIRAIHGKTVRDKIRSDQLQQLSRNQDIVKWDQCQKKRVSCSGEQNGGATVWQRSPEIIVHRD
jgi:hypothetical protein